MRPVTARRRCLICDWNADVLEDPDALEIGGDCPECHAPTERVAVLANRKIANPHAAALGRLGGLKGGPARAAALSARERREMARRAAIARWRRHRK